MIREVRMTEVYGDWLPLPVACRAAGVAYSALYDRVTSGQIQSIRIDGKWFVAKRAVERLRKGPGGQPQ